jgi:aspartate/methionine/tyrosine aminotransferase
MFMSLFVSTVVATCTAEPIVEPTLDTQQPINAIRTIFYQIPSVNLERAALGLDPVINLSIGQPHIPMQMQALDTFIQYLEGLKDLPSEEFCMEMGYSNSAGLLDTRKWISQFFTKSFPKVPGGFTLDEVMVTNGATGALSGAFKVLLQEGDEVVVLSPYFAAYKNQVKGCRAHLVSIPLTSDRSPASLLADYLHAHPKAKVFIWNDPNNPLGTKADEKDLRELAAVIANYPNLVVIHDEVYKDIVYDGPSLSLLDVAPEMKDRSFIIRSLSKDILGAPGIRAGMIAAPIHMKTPSGKRVNFIELMSNEQLCDISNVSIFVQKILTIALQQKLSGISKEWEESARNEYAKNTKLVIQSLGNLGLHPLVVPRGAFYVMIDATPLIGKKIPEKMGQIHNLTTKVSQKIQNDLDVATFFLHAAGVAVIPSSGFGLNQCAFRISCAKPQDQLLKAIEKIGDAIHKLEN